MTATSVIGPGRVVQFLWGANQQNTLEFAYPMSVDNPRFFRAPRKGSELAVQGPTSEGWTTARDYYGDLQLRWIQLNVWSGLVGVQAFLDWGINGQPFTFVPDAANAPLFSIPGCVLMDPFDKGVPGNEADGSQNIPIRFRNPTYDLGLAWR